MHLNFTLQILSQENVSLGKMHIMPKFSFKCAPTTIVFPNVTKLNKSLAAKGTGNLKAISAF